MKKLGITIAFVSLVLFGCNETNKTQTTEVNNVLNVDNITLQTFEIDNTKDTLIKGTGGTLVTIPQNSFTDKKGNPIVGKVVFELKEILTPIDMVLGNFTTTSDGKILQTGGMIYTNAKANNENIVLANNRILTINIPSKNRKDSMLIFSGEVNPETKSINWINSEDIIEDVLPSISKNDTLINEHLVEPLKPIKIDKKSNRLLSIKFENDKMFPELKHYRDFKFRVSEKSDFNLEDSKKTWHDVKLTKKKTEGEYSVTFTGIDKGKTITKTYIVSPAFDGKNYEKALAIYENKFKQYEEKKKKIEELKDVYKFKNNNISDERLGYVYSIKKLGWTNIDRFYSDSRTATIDLKIQIDNKNDDESVFISLLIKKLNFYIPGYQKKDGTYGFSHNDAEPTNLPIGEEAIIIATTYRKGVPYFAFQKIIIAKKQEIKLNLTETTKDKLVAYLKENI